MKMLFKSSRRPSPALRIHRDNFAIEAAKALLTFGHKLRLKPAGSISRHFDLEFAFFTEQCLFAAAIAMVRSPLAFFKPRRLALFVTQIMAHLRSKYSLVEPLGQLFHDPSRTPQIFRSLIPLQQLFNDCRIDLRLLAFRA
jgi:hypothetical protein